MTGRERLLAAFHGGQPDTAPFSPNLYYWFYNQRIAGGLPPELADAQHPFDVLRYLGADILARWDTQHATREEFLSGGLCDEFGGWSRFTEPMVTAFNTYPPHTNIRRRSFATPYGTLTHQWTLSEQAGADFESEYWWKDWSEYDAVRYFLESRDYSFDAGLFHHWVQAVGNDGLVMAHFTQSPLKTFHWLAGAENASLFLIDHPDEMKELAAIHERKALALLESIADNPEAEVFLSLDNMDSAFYPPYFYRDYCHPFYAEAARIIHSRGKIFLVHACGRDRALMTLVGKSGIDCLEGLTPPPLGDVPLHEARSMTGNENFTVNGGMDTPHLELREDAEAGIHHYTRELFASMGDKRHFVFASSCSTPAITPWQNLISFRDAAREYGRT
jgi:hypothetical protein